MVCLRTHRRRQKVVLSVRQRGLFKPLFGRLFSIDYEQLMKFHIEIKKLTRRILISPNPKRFDCHEIAKRENTNYKKGRIPCVYSIMLKLSHVIQSHPKIASFHSDMNILFQALNAISRNKFHQHWIILNSCMLVYSGLKEGNPCPAVRWPVVWLLCL